MNTASAAPRERLPLTVVGGFLGAGKTTLLNRLLQHSRGRRLALLVNDFGALNIDAELIASRGADTIALSNGCACCTIGDDLGAALIRVLDAEPAFDAVWVEASGVADPWRIAQVGLVDPGLAMAGVIVLVDAGAAIEQAADPLLADSLLRQLRAADLVVVNKTDRAAADALARVHRWLNAVVPGTPRFETTRSRLPLAMLADLPLPAASAGEPAAQRRPSPADALDHDDRFDTAAWRPDAVLSAAALRDWLCDMPKGVLRLKGLLRTDAHGWSELQFAGRHGSLRPALREPAGGAAVVAIGLRGRLPRTALAAFWGAPIDADARHADAD